MVFQAEIAEKNQNTHLHVSSLMLSENGAIYNMEEMAKKIHCCYSIATTVTRESPCNVTHTLPILLFDHEVKEVALRTNRKR
jgi:hypothetical protein